VTAPLRVTGGVASLDGTPSTTLDAEHTIAVDLPLYERSNLARGIVVALIGDSNSAGVGGAVLETGIGPREALQRCLHEAGVRFRMVGTRGWGSTNGTGTMWGRFPNVEDYHDAPQIVMSDWRSDGHGGRRLSKMTVATNVNTGTGVITAAGHTLTDGAPVYLTTTGVLPTISVVQSVYFARDTNIGTGVLSLAQYDGGPALTISGAGSGILTINEGLGEIVPGIFAGYDVAPTDIIAEGGINDMTALVAAGGDLASRLATMQTRATAYFAAIDAAATATARKYATSVSPPATTLASYADVEALRVAYNSWLSTYIETRGALWTFVDAAAGMTAAHITSDTLHPYRSGYDMRGVAIARAIIAGSKSAVANERWPLPIARLAPQACVNIPTSSGVITFPNQTTLQPSTDNFFFAIWYYPYDALTSTAAILQCENPFTNGVLVFRSLNNIQLHWKGTIVAPAGSYNAVLKRHRWHRIFCFYDRTRSEVGLFLNGQLVQRVHVAAQTGITSSTGWYCGGAGLASSVGLYQRFLFGHSSTANINDAARLAARDYWLGEDPPSTTAKYHLSEGTGTSVAGTVAGSTAGTMSGSAAWIASGRYKKPVDQGYIKPTSDKRPTAVTAAYPATYDETVPCDPTGGGFTVTLPTAVGFAGRRVVVKNVTSSTNTITIGATIDGVASPTIAAAYGSMTVESDDANWMAV
jgi:hypothetical protein